MPGHRDLVVRQKAMELVTEVYKVTRTFPKDEWYGLVVQVRRAAVSVASNIAEGYGRNSRNELHHFVGQARGSLAEVETQIEIARNLGYLSKDVCGEPAGRHRPCRADANRLAGVVGSIWKELGRPLATSYQLLATKDSV